MANAAEVIMIQFRHECKMCKRFNVNALIKCRQAIPYTIVEGNSVDLFLGSLKFPHGYTKKMKIHVLIDTWANLIIVSMEYVGSKDCTGEHIICRTCKGSQDRWELAWVKIHSPFINTTAKYAVLPNLFADPIVGNVEDVREVEDIMLKQWNRENDR